MKQCISTAGDSGHGDPTVAVPADVDTSADEIMDKARIAMSVACGTEAGARPIPPIDEDGCSAFFEPVPAMLAVLSAAVRIEPDPSEAGVWYRCTCIAEFGGLTAAQLVSLGRVEAVIGFLHAIRDGTRD